MPRYHVAIDEQDFDIELEYHAEKFLARVNGKTCEIERARLGDSRSLLIIDGHAYEVDVHSNGSDGRRLVFLRGTEIIASIEDYNLAQIRKTAGISTEPAVETVIRAPMPGLIIDVVVSDGDSVKTGDVLMIIEAMKMENVVKAKAPAKVKMLHVKPGTSVEKGEKLLEFE
jgi:biotin carboxyl carrier protein